MTNAKERRCVAEQKEKSKKRKSQEDNDSSRTSLVARRLRSNVPRRIKTRRRRQVRVKPESVNYANWQELQTLFTSLTTLISVITRSNM